MLRVLVEWAIVFYRRRLSPLKGYRCAYGALHGGDTCSALILEVVRHRPPRDWWRGARAQFSACRSAYDLIQANRRRDDRRRRRWTDCCDPSGVCDCVDLARPCGRGIGNCDIDFCGS